MLFDIKHARVGPDAIAESIERLESYRKTLLDIVELENYDEDEASLLLPTDLSVLESVQAMAGLVSGKLRYIILIGIGGSNLGAKAVYDALFGTFDVLKSDRFPKILFPDTNDTKTLLEMTALLRTLNDPEEVLINVITKSGSTTETVANAEILLNALQEKFGEAFLERVVVTSGDNSPLTKSAKKKNMRTLSVPEKVGGRFSAFSSVGLFPLFCAGVDIEALLQGASSMRKRCLDEGITKNIALQSAATLYLLRKEGKTIHTTFLFHPELRTLGEWYRQLLAESIGKKENDSGNIIRAGIMPEVSIGSTDLHSVAQLYLGGPKDKMTTFVSVHKLGGVVAIPEARIFADVLPNISGKTAEEIMNAILNGTKKAYVKAELPFMEVVLEELSPYELGQFMQFKMCEIMYLGKLFEINAFNQPNVEEYKTETKKILED